MSSLYWTSPDNDFGKHTRLVPKETHAPRGHLPRTDPTTMTQEEKAEFLAAMYNLMLLSSYAVYKCGLPDQGHRTPMRQKISGHYIRVLRKREKMPSFTLKIGIIIQNIMNDDGKSDFNFKKLLEELSIPEVQESATKDVRMDDFVILFIDKVVEKWTKKGANMGFITIAQKRLGIAPVSAAAAAEESGVTLGEDVEIVVRVDKGVWDEKNALVAVKTEAPLVRDVTIAKSDREEGNWDDDEKDAVATENVMSTISCACGGGEYAVVVTHAEDC